ncbi:Uncharacterized membrane-anchored protein [Pseudorhodobacter antarcticus]|uniref:Uncharacterized membrane-anchored protein n=1 Tax=Pseudorhodobacter antarcticus TaxID=1077947 RepID=A0A1H8GDR4_9RHOB|nr:DUF3422 domain-containing protein [Pseudorhodobacter antarcticus]SEN41438.1 Uncharacterized membrane-anchored protein [Pseudorhodobacter antarcticus]
MSKIKDHPLRYDLVNELHARPFPALSVPSHAVYIAIKEPERAVSRDRSKDLAHLLGLLDRHASPHPQPEATHFSGGIGRHNLKWESHTEFVTYSAFGPGVSTRAFDPMEADVFPADWLATAPGSRLVSVLIRVEEMLADEDEMLAKLGDWFVPESLAISRVVDGAAVIAGDFRIDQAGHMRFAVFVQKGTGARRVGRIVQRLCEVETYRAMSMLGLVRARGLGAQLNRLDPQLATMISGMTSTGQAPEAVLKTLLEISAELESLGVQSSFRFGATAAYEAIVTQRVSVMRETRVKGLQTFGEFMMRRYDPAMRTVKSVEARLGSMAERATRAAELLRTRVDVERSAQNQRLLESMDARADLQLRLQTTVEGLSVVAISYYAMNILAYVIYPVTDSLGLSKGWTMAVLAPLVILGVWGLVRRIRNRLH